MLQHNFSHFKKTNIDDSVVSIEERIENLKLTDSISQILFIPHLHVFWYLFNIGGKFFYWRLIQSCFAFNFFDLLDWTRIWHCFSCLLCLCLCFCSTVSFYWKYIRLVLSHSVLLSSSWFCYLPLSNSRLLELHLIKNSFVFILVTLFIWILFDYTKIFLF